MFAIYTECEEVVASKQTNIQKLKIGPWKQRGRDRESMCETKDTGRGGQWAVYTNDLEGAQAVQRKQR
jgi:hypothetical protein